MENRSKGEGVTPGGAFHSDSFKAPLSPPPTPSLSSHSSIDESLHATTGNFPGTPAPAISRFTARSRNSLVPGDPIQIDGYSNAQVISVHYDDIVAVRALSTSRGDRRVLLKFSLSASRNAAAQFKAEAALLDALKEHGIHNVSRIIARESGSVGAIIVAEDEAGRFLLHEMYLIDRAPGPYWNDPDILLRTIEMTITLVQLLSSIHNLSIVHGSLRPTTISASPSFGPHLHDFSAAFRVGLDGYSNPIRERGMHEASLPYLAPESSGRIGRHADYRSDYYSLGAVLFHILTGRVPFADCGPDPLEIIHAHIAKRPPLASTLDESIPLPLAQVVAKLLEKAPEARYQTSQGLVIDLLKIAAAIRSSSRSPSSFIVGSVDEAAHFRLPPASRLFGREASVQALLACYCRVETDHTSEVVIVVGVSGIDKTSLVEMVRKPVVQAQGFYTSVKFDQIKSPVPFFAISQALFGLFRQLLAESESELVQWRRHLSKVLSDEGRILADVLPALENIFDAGWIDTLPSIVPLEPKESEARFRGIVQRVLRTFARAGRPLVIMFDDLQWSTSSDLAFILSLLASDDEASTSPSSLLVLCLWRDNEVTPDHIINTILLPRLPEVKLYIKLQPLEVHDVAALVSESLRKPRLLAEETPAPERDDANLRELSELICRKTGGSPLFVAQLLKALNTDGFFSFDFTVGRWVYDVEQIASQALYTDIVDLLRSEMQRFSPLGQEFLLVAACIGNEEISAQTLSQATGRSVVEVTQGMQEAVRKGLILPSGALEAAVTPPLRPHTTLASLSTPIVPASYRFFHDRCQQAAYSLASPSEISAMHYRIGQNLLSNTSDEDLLDCIFDLTNQLNHGIGTLATEERDHLARFNYLAGRKASRSTAFEAARAYLSIAWDLLGSGSGNGSWEGQPGLWCDVLEELIEVEYFLVDFAASQKYVQTFLRKVTDPVRRLSVYARSLRSATAMGDSMRAIAIGREGLAMVGIEFPDDAAGGEALEQEVREEVGTDTLIGALSSAHLPNPLAAGVQAILAACAAPVYFTQINLLGPLTSLAVRKAFRNGLDGAGAMMLSLYAVFIQDKYQEFTRGHALGRIATAYFDRDDGSPFAPPTYKIFASHIAVWSDPIRETFPDFRKAISYAISYGDGIHLGFGSAELCAYSIICGVSLEEITSSLETFSVLVRKFRNELSTLYIAVVHQSAMSFAGNSENPCDIEGEAFSMADKRIVHEKHYAIIQIIYHMFELMLACFFNDSRRAKDAIRLGRPALPGGAGILFPVIFKLFEAVMLFDDPSALTAADVVVLSDTMTLFDELAKLQKSNFFHMRLWLKAEEARSRGDTKAALEFYDHAIAAATAERFIHFAACCNERAAAMLTSPKIAAGYILDAHAQWKTWGCAPKVTDIEARHPHLFGRPPATTGLGLFDLPSTEPTSGLYVLEKESKSMREEANPFQRSRVHSPVLHRRRSTSSGGSGEVSASGIQSEPRNESESLPRSHFATELDLRTVVSASSVLGQETSVDGVVSKLLGLALRTAGAELVLLVLNKGGVLCPEAIARSDSTEVKHLHSLDCIETQPDQYPVSVINYVARSREMVVNDLDAMGEAIPDPYLIKHRPKSILCLALVSQSQVVGVLFMQNSQTMNTFTPNHLEILSLISSQAASTARLVHDLKSANEDLKRSQATLEGYNRNLENVVSSRTIELRDQNTRLETEISEKELAQAEMRSAKEVAESATAMKSQFLANMSHEIRTPFNAVLSLTSLLLDTNLDPLQMDYVETIKNSSQGLLVVINDILDYSKIELDHLELSPEKVQLRNTLEASMDMVAESAAAKSVELALVLEQGDIDVFTDLCRLRQILVNLLSNAVKFTSNGEVTITCSAHRIEPTSAGEEFSRVRISVKDSGIGIAESDFPKLFRVFSQVDGSETTKLFGGTGLGLAISRKLSILLGGDITVQSVVGKGSTFTLEFVAPAAPPPTTDPFTPAQNPDLAGKRCLIIDTNETSRNVLKGLILSFGMAPEAPEDLSTAFQVAIDASDDGRPFDLFIVDSFMPGVAARMLLLRFRERGLFTPTIALSRMGFPLLEAFRQLKCTALIKPIKRNRLHHTLRQVFPAGELSRRLRTGSPSPGTPFPIDLAGRNPLALLCAEDNPINVKVITHLLKRMGYTTEIAEDGQVAVEKVQQKRFDLIFMDVNMPRMNGLEATRRIVELFPETRPYIVAMTANCMVEDKTKCIQAGCDDFISKPILVPELVAALNAAGDRARSRTPLRPSTANSKSSPTFKIGLITSDSGTVIFPGPPRTSNSSPTRFTVPLRPA